MFNYTDHLGNIRLRYTSTGLGNGIQKLEENHYYPFGLKHKKYNSYQYVFVALNEIDGYDLGIDPLPERGRDEYQYKYNGKEWQDELGFNVYALDWRQYDPAIGRFMTIDPETDEPEQLDKSAYAFAWNNPVLHNDPDGRNPIKGLIKKMLKSMGDDGVKFTAKTTKGTMKPVSRVHAEKILKEQKSVFKTNEGSVRKEAKKLMKDASGDSKVVRHDGHEIVNKQGEKTGKTGFDHYQKKSGDGSHVFYDNVKNGAAIGTVTTSTTSKKDTSEEVAEQLTSVGATMTDTVENIGTKIFGDNNFGRVINELNPLNLDLSEIFKKADDSLNKKKTEQ